MAHNRTQTEGPGEQGHGIFKPDGAEKMPTKHYPSSGKMGHEGKKTTIEGPCSGKEGYK